MASVREIVDTWGAGQESLKKMAGEAAAGAVKGGRVIGMGTGSTVRYAILRLGTLVAGGLDIVAIPTSLQTERLCIENRIKVGTPNDYDSVDLCIDGADEVDPQLNLIKGGGGALTREKIVASMAKRFLVVIDEGKLVERLGKFPVAVECLGFGKRLVKRRLEALGASVLERDFTTDNGNRILDARFGRIADPEALEREIDVIPGVLENGIFPCRLASRVYVGSAAGLKVIEKGVARGP